MTPFHSQRSQARGSRAPRPKVTQQEGQISALGSLMALLPVLGLLWGLTGGSGGGLPWEGLREGSRSPRPLSSASSFRPALGSPRGASGGGLGPPPLCHSHLPVSAGMTWAAHVPSLTVICK